ncbi:TIGR01777 family protein [Echinicola sp. CAU 1574]|uniref:TIGR01777 family protein n=1 Tax=Echinicola arenosa TaxID=2774144 RepID=A0ABR9APB9_9BACT|nr:TIGR01777 family oxidoreductase [Echinicola arenosa]MBD8489708.1 TIGR01777 family protein [Echinicola arenosa]
MKNILITGGSGLVGKELTKALESKGYQVAWLSRKPAHQSQKSFGWDVKKQEIDAEAIPWADAIIHLAGAGVAEKRWTPERKKLILESRTLSAKLLFEQVRTLEKKPSVVISASGSNLYGLDNGEVWINEESPAGSDFLSQVVVKWEKSVQQFESLGIRTVCLRTGVVLSTKGGALPQLLQPPVAAPLGSGHQYMSWIHWKDLVNMYIFALENTNITGGYNAVAPKPVTNRELTKQAAKHKGKAFINLPVPGFLLKIVLGEMADMILGGSKISCDKIISGGYKFDFTTLDHTLKDLFKP